MHTFNYAGNNPITIDTAPWQVKAESTTSSRLVDGKPIAAALRVDGIDCTYTDGDDLVFRFSAKFLVRRMASKGYAGTVVA